MVSGRLKSRRLRRVFVKTSKGTTIHYKQRNRSPTKCAVTKKPLKGIPRLTNRKFKNLPKSKKTVSRKYGGYMSAEALRKMLVEEVISKED